MENTNVTEQSTNEIMPMAASGETNFASLTEKTIPASGDMFLMEDSEDTKKINYDKLADAILNKLTSKTYSGLETTAKNFVAAINELNSKRYVQILSNQAVTGANETMEIDVSKYKRGMLFVLFNAGGSTQQSNILYSFSKSNNNKTSLVEMINKNQQASGYKIESVALNQDTLEITTGIYGGSMIVIYFGV